MSKRHSGAIKQEYKAYLKGEPVFLYGQYAKEQFEQLIVGTEYHYSKIRERGTVVVTHAYRKKEKRSD